MSAAPTATPLLTVPKVSAIRDELERVYSPEPFFSDIECACGCRNLLTSAWARCGRRYIRGHLPAPTVIPTKRRLSVSVSATNPRKMAEFFDAELATAEKQIADAEAEHKALGDKMAIVRARIDKLRGDIQATKRLRAEVDQFFRARAAAKP